MTKRGSVSAHYFRRLALQSLNMTEEPGLKNRTLMQKLEEKFPLPKGVNRSKKQRYAYFINAMRGIETEAPLPKLSNKTRKPKPTRQRLNNAKKARQDFYSSEEWMELRYRALKTADGCCQCCGNRPTKENPLHVDHIKPRSRFPELELVLDNLQILCKQCNLGKSAWDHTDWRDNVIPLARIGER